MATYQKRNGRVTATVRIKPHPPKSKTHDTMRDAKAWAQDLEVKLRNEKVQIFDHIILRDALIEYRDTVSIKKKSADKEITRLNFFLKHMKCDIPLVQVDKQFLIDWCEMRLNKAQSGTVQRELMMFSGFLTWCKEIKLWIGSNPAREVQKPKAGNHRERVIDDEEIEAITPFLNSDLKDIFYLALETGMRQAEICGLTWNRVFIDKSFLRLDKTKNGRAREVPLSQKAKSILKERRKKQSLMVFEYAPYDVCKDFREAREAANLSGFRFHDTRHTAATRIAQKIQVLDLCKMFGWNNPKQAMTYYNATASEIASRL
ncbi:site-specific integrase [Acinetobacter colistiniresistens]|uniref:tyrosine-type recombinase/integrase n=1 Tax=Acinetobacter colistiniresistens TaxID=280145 RepID=UPI00211CD4CA|nr:site-specific integrase [Acinetobacter colistiniresistens]UUM27175.1 site-specific integrase [Acinetobacter colistiniresistens]